MGWLAGWWQLDVIDGGKGPLLLSFVAFVLTFVITRTITRMIRAGRGPFGNLSAGGVHLHHSTPGLIMLIVGAFTAVGAGDDSTWNYVAAALIGIGSSLVLDEFAMIFRLQDVYWSRDGQLSVNMVTLAAGCIGLAVIGFSPAQVPELSAVAARDRWIVAGMLLIHFGVCAVTALKGKYATMLIGLFVFPVDLVGAVRLARPTSPWARWFYDPRVAARAQAREDRFNGRWGPIRSGWDDFIGGSPSPAATPTPPAPAPSPPEAGTPR